MSFNDVSFLKAVQLKHQKELRYDVYPLSLPCIQQLESIDLHPRVTFFVGENGSGKSTLLEAIAVAYGFNAEGGSRHFKFQTKATHSQLWEYLRLIKSHKRPKDGFFLRAESFYNVATDVEQLNAGSSPSQFLDGYGGKSLHEQSHGESFLNLMLHRFRGEGLYILDEPEAALSPSRQLSMLTALDDQVKGGSQFIIATHSPILLAYPNAKIISFDQGVLKDVPYEKTEHYSLTKYFLNNYKGMLEQLLDTVD